MNINKIFIVLIVLGMVSSMLSCNHNSDKVVLVKSESYFSDYEVEDNLVNIKCYLTIHNMTDLDKTIKLKAVFPNDVNVLIKTATLYAKDNDGNDMKFKLPSKNKTSFDVIFVGEFAGTNQKNDRELPEIIIENVES